MRYNKYHAQKVTTTDGVFDSRKEYRRWCELKVLERAKKISDLQRQVPYELIPKQGKVRECKYIADFIYTDNGTGKVVVEDAKGVRTDAYRIKKKLMLYVHGISISEV